MARVGISDNGDIYDKCFDNTTTETCANCGKEGASNICNKCKSVKYCNAACKKKHRSKHKKQCERRVAELRDIKLFKQPPPSEECPSASSVCHFLILGDTGYRYKSCCGKTICSGCIYAVVKGKQLYHCVLFAEFHLLHLMRKLSN